MQFPITTDQTALASEKCNTHSHFIQQQIPQLFQDYSHNMGRGNGGNGSRVPATLRKKVPRSAVALKSLHGKK